ncbi:MAG: metalloregulator ArsR/SmtB family transcription factor [Tetrasphaera sp.]
MHADMQGSPWASDVVTLAVEVLRVLADPTRLQIAGLLLDEEKSVSDLAAELDRPGPGVSQHLAKMRMARLVTTRRQGTSVLYRVENDHVRQLVIDTIGHVEHLLEEIPAHHRPLRAASS